MSNTRFRLPTITIRAAWSWTWPKLFAIALVLGAWEILYLSEWRPSYVLPGPIETFAALFDMVGTERFWLAVKTTITRAGSGFLLALVIGSIVGIAVARIKPLRLAVGNVITGLQVMPSIAWFPLAILVFGLNEQAILFVVVLGAGSPHVASAALGSCGY